MNLELNSNTVPAKQLLYTQRLENSFPCLGQAVNPFKALGEQVCSDIGLRYVTWGDFFPYALYLCASVGKQFL